MQESWDVYLLKWYIDCFIDLVPIMIEHSPVETDVFQNYINFKLYKWNFI